MHDYITKTSKLSDVYFDLIICKEISAFSLVKIISHISLNVNFKKIMTYFLKFIHIYPKNESSFKMQIINLLKTYTTA